MFGTRITHFVYYSDSVFAHTPANQPASAADCCSEVHRHGHSIATHPVCECKIKRANAKK